MFDYFSNKKSSNPNESVFGGLTSNQKMSITNLLIMIARCDGMYNKQEMEYLNTCNLDYSVNQCSAYLESAGVERMFNDLKGLTSSQKNYLIITTFELMSCDGRPNEQEYNVFLNFFEKLGYTEDAILEVIQKVALLKKKFV
jgi:hypothetical protein